MIVLIDGFGNHFKLKTIPFGLKKNKEKTKENKTKCMHVIIVTFAY
jgi:hypothetical protein